MFGRRVFPAASRFARMASSSAAPRVAPRAGAAVGVAALAAGVGAALYARSQQPLLAAAPPVKTAAGTKGGVERTFIAIKPDGVQRGLISEVIHRFERRGYKLLAEEHYGDLKARPFYKGLVNYMTSGKAPVIAMVWEGIDVIRQGRRIIGATNPLESEPGSFRGDYTISVGRNAIHGSDSFESATVEIDLWFKPEEVYNWKFAHEEWITSAN
ncbi:nucleoside diphosphate kinase, partial [Obelidium mucronatum]